MADEGGYPIPAQVGRVRERFKNWCEAKLRRMPERLWAAAIRLCDLHRVHDVTGWLCLNDTPLRERVQSARRKAGLHGRGEFALTFVEWVSTTSVTVSPVIEYGVELKDGHGTGGAGVHEAVGFVTPLLMRGERA